MNLRKEKIKREKELKGIEKENKELKFSLEALIEYNNKLEKELIERKILVNEKIDSKKINELILLGLELIYKPQ